MKPDGTYTSHELQGLDESTKLHETHESHVPHESIAKDISGTQFSLTPEGRALIRRAREAYKQAYVPYSHYPVGAAALFKGSVAEARGSVQEPADDLSQAQDGGRLESESGDLIGDPENGSILAERIFSGCNVENASYGLTVCAERNAIFQAVAGGRRTLQGIAIAVPTEDFPSPCGACRQVIREFTDDCPVILVNGRGDTKETSLQALLPDSFGPEFL